MRKVYRPLSIALLAVLLCSCGVAEPSSDLENTIQLIEKIPDDDPTRQEYSDQSNEHASNANTVDAEGMAAASSMDLYEQFLNGEAKVRVRLDKIQNLDAYGEANLRDESEYTLSELQAAVSKSDGEQSVSYAYMDCGNDGEPELAVRTETNQEYNYWWEYWVIKDIDGNLECIYGIETWPRSYVTISQYGLISGSGSGGAFYHTSDEGYLDASGAYHYIYNLSTTMFPVSQEGYGWLSDFDFYFPDMLVDNMDEDVEYTESVEEEAASDEEYRSFILYEYDFDNTPDNKLNDAFRYTEQDIQDGSAVGEIEDDSIYADNFPLKVQLVNAGLQLYSHAETDEMIDMQEKYYGITQEILDAPELEWITLSAQ